MKKFEGMLFCTDLDGTLYTGDKRVSKENLEAIEYFKSEGGLFTFITGRVPVTAMDIYEREHILRNVNELEGHLFEGLDNLRKKYSIVYDVRGKGLFFGIELASNQDGQPFAPDLRIAERLNEKAMELGAVFYPGNGTVNGYAGDHLIIAPPLIISEREVDELISLLDDALKDLADSLKEGT